MIVSKKNLMRILTDTHTCSLLFCSVLHLVCMFHDVYSCKPSVTSCLGRLVKKKCFFFSFFMTTVIINVNKLLLEFHDGLNLHLGTFIILLPFLACGKRQWFKIANVSGVIITLFLMSQEYLCFSTFNQLFLQGYVQCFFLWAVVFSNHEKEMKDRVSHWADQC